MPQCFKRTSVCDQDSNHFACISAERRNPKTEKPVVCELPTIFNHSVSHKMLQDVYGFLRSILVPLSTYLNSQQTTLAQFCIPEYVTICSAPISYSSWIPEQLTSEKKMHACLKSFDNVPFS